MTRASGLVSLGAALLFAGSCGFGERVESVEACLERLERGLRPVAKQRAERFLGKVQQDTAECRGPKASMRRDTPWVDWSNYWATGDAGSKRREPLGVPDHLTPNGRGIDGALLDLEYQRMELIRFNLLDNSGTYPDYVTGRGDVPGPVLKVWPEMKLPPEHSRFADVGGAGEQLCGRDLIRFRTLTGICNDLRNPLMGSSGQPFARNVALEATFPRLAASEGDELARNRHGERLGLLQPDPQVISRELFTRVQSDPERCNGGQGLAGWSAEAECEYQKAPFFNVLAAFWIQFMTHDWFSHLVEGRNRAELMEVGCSEADAAALGCRPGDRMEKAYVAEAGPPPTFTTNGTRHLGRAYRTTANTVTAWWDASQLYGHDETSRRRVKRDPADPARLRMDAVPGRSGAGDGLGYLPLLEASDPMNPAWRGQEATAFPDNWSVGLSFFHNVFAREHNAFVDAFRARAARTPDDDSGLRDPARPGVAIRYRDVGADELFEVARLVVAAEIAKIHTIEWTTQLLYNEPLHLGMNANWSGLFGDSPLVSKALDGIVSRLRSADVDGANQLYSALAAGPGIIGLGSHRYERRLSSLFLRRDYWSIDDPDDVNGGTNHFGSPFNFPEEFVTVYRLHPLLPDLLEYRDWSDAPNRIRNRVPVVETFRGRATAAMRDRGLASWGVSLGRQRLGLLTLGNHPQFLQNLELPRLQTETGRIDVAALDLIRDRERGVPGYNELRRQLGLRQLTRFDDFVDVRTVAGSAERRRQERVVEALRRVYGQHRCDASKRITTAQVNPDGSPITDCLGHPDGSEVDNIEDVDAVVGWLAEYTRPHGFAISETQFQVFILNASRRLFSDRFFTSSFRPEFYGYLGIAWVNDNGPDGKVMERGTPNGHEQEVAPLKRVLLRTIPELEPELRHVVNTFDPWSRDRGEYYALEWNERLADVAGAP